MGPTLCMRRYLHCNQLSGSIPPSLGQLVNLHTLYLQNNQLSGPIDASLCALKAEYVDISNNYLTHNENIPTHWKQENAFQEPTASMRAQERAATESAHPSSAIPQTMRGNTHNKEHNLLSEEMQAHLQLEHNINEEHTACLSQLVVSGDSVPTSLDEWMARGLDMGFPDNGVWSAVAHALESMPSKAEEAVKQHATTQARITTLKSELQQLEAQQAQWAQWEQPMARLQAQSAAMLHMAQQLSQVEQRLSVQAMQQFMAHALPPSDDEEEEAKPVAGQAMSASAWQAILRAAGMSAQSAEQLKEHMHDVLDDDDFKPDLNVHERYDLQYLRHMVECKSVPFVHPFHERYRLNKTLAGDDAPLGPYQSEHSCIVCECGSAKQLQDLVVERKSALAKVDWKAHGINGPRMLVMTKKEIQPLLENKKDINAVMKAFKVLKNKHMSTLYQD